MKKTKDDKSVMMTNFGDLH